VLFSRLDVIFALASEFISRFISPCAVIISLPVRRHQEQKLRAKTESLKSLSGFDNQEV